MGCGSSVSAHADILVVDHNKEAPFSSTNSSYPNGYLKSISQSQVSLRSRKSKMESAEPLDTSPEKRSSEFAPVEPSNPEEMQTELKRAPAKRFTEEEVLQKLDEVIPRLHAMTSYNSKECAADLTFLRKYSAHSDDNDRRVRYFDTLAERGITKIFLKIWTELFPLDFVSEEQSATWNNMKCILIVMWNGTDRSQKLCQKVLDDKVGQYSISLLQDSKIGPEKTDGLRTGYTVKGLYGILHNTLQYCDARHTFREAGVVDVLKQYLDSPNLMVSLWCTLKTKTWSKLVKWVLRMGRG